MSDCISIRVKTINGKAIAININSYNTVWDLKTRVFEEKGLPPDKIRLVYKGKILQNELSLNHYNIKSGENVFLALTPTKVSRSEIAVNISKELVTLIGSLQTCSSSEYSRIIKRIETLRYDTTLISAARLIPSIQEIIEYTDHVLETTESPPSEDITRYISQKRDQSLTNIESTPSGLRLLQGIYDDDDEDEMDYNQSLPDIPTKINYTSRISNRPLPVPWQRKRIFRNVGVSISARDPHLKYKNMKEIRERFSRQVEAIKEMGFKDEKVILEALDQSGGNIQDAVRILESKCLFKC